MGGRINGEHARSIANAEDGTTREALVDEACQGGDRLDLRDVVFTVDRSLVEVRRTPTVGHIEVQCCGEHFCCASRVGVAPRAEGGEQSSVLVQCNVAVHHRGETQGGKCRDGSVVAGLDVLHQRGVSPLEALPYGGLRIGPEIIGKLVLPVMRAAGDDGSLPVNKHCFDASRPELNTQCGCARVDDGGGGDIADSCCERCGLSWLKNDEVGTGIEGIGRARHGFNGNTLALLIFC